MGIKFELAPPDGVLKIVTEISIFEVISIIGIFAGLFSLLAAISALRSQAKTRRAEFSFRVWEAFMDDSVQKAYLEIEWREFDWPYDERNGFESPDQERRIDRLLYLLDEIALLIDNKVLPQKDKERWSYQGVRVFRDPSIRRYIDFLDEFYGANGILGRPHNDARNMFDQESG